MLGFQENVLAAMALAVAWLVTAVLANAGFAKLMGMLRERHTALWEQLGKPNNMTRLSPDASKALKQMVTAGADYDTDDTDMRAHLAWLSKVLLVSRVLSVMLVVWILALIVDV